MTDLTRISENIGLSVADVEQVVIDFHEKFEEGINVQTVTDAVIELMAIVGKFKKLSGENKKNLVTEVLIFIVHETDSGEFDTILDHVIVNIIPVLIDRLISVENGKIIINKHTKMKIAKCMPCLF